MEIKDPKSTRLSQDLVFDEESRSYTCSFCKRGFSNAQALGGHMNVHRRDRARLQESIQETLITTQTQKAFNLNSIHQPDDQEQSSNDDDDDDDKGVSKRPLKITEANSDHEHHRRKKYHAVNLKKPILQLSLCIEPSSIYDHDSSIRSSNFSSLSSASATEVDLELRLGMDSDTISRDRVIQQ
ncbi:hypothetical protein SSX86_022621 [Deinandra increscens subsp. villosa]|uniref:C2H2-type domain-containing protein n=1 Tax=Deinandra increscens subsp. villosa TaxID=3103831 RepID=A0AAP0CN85_9ASTR